MLNAQEIKNSYKQLLTFSQLIAILKVWRHHRHLNKTKTEVRAARALILKILECKAEKTFLLSMDSNK